LLDQMKAQSASHTFIDWKEGAAELALRKVKATYRHLNPGSKAAAEAQYSAAKKAVDIDTQVKKVIGVFDTVLSGGAEQPQAKLDEHSKSSLDPVLHQALTGKTAPETIPALLDALSLLEQAANPLANQRIYCMLDSDKDRLPQDTEDIHLTWQSGESRDSFGVYEDEAKGDLDPNQKRHMLDFRVPIYRVKKEKKQRFREIMIAVNGPAEIEVPGTAGTKMKKFDPDEMDESGKPANGKKGHANTVISISSKLDMRFLPPVNGVLVLWFFF